jgi:valyl-tRNA synthetase
VEIRVIGKMARRSSQISLRRLSKLRLHTRNILRDRTEAFLGSQSLRELELDARREIGVIFEDAKIIDRIAETFEEDWKQGTVVSADEDDAKPPAARVAKKVAKTVTRVLPPIAPVVEEVVNQVLHANNGLGIDHEEVEETVKVAVKQAVKQAVREVVEDVVEQQREPEA